jgi:hypothetical protein
MGGTSHGAFFAAPARFSLNHAGCVSRPGDGSGLEVRPEQKQTLRQLSRFALDGKHIADLTDDEVHQLEDAIVAEADAEAIAAEAQTVVAEKTPTDAAMNAAVAHPSGRVTCSNGVPHCTTCGVNLVSESCACGY